MRKILFGLLALISLTAIAEPAYAELDECSLKVGKDIDNDAKDVLTRKGYLLTSGKAQLILKFNQKITYSMVEYDWFIRSNAWIKKHKESMDDYKVNFKILEEGTEMELASSTTKKSQKRAAKKLPKCKHLDRFY